MLPENNNTNYDMATILNIIYRFALGSLLFIFMAIACSSIIIPTLIGITAIISGVISFLFIGLATLGLCFSLTFILFKTNDFDDEKDGGKDNKSFFTPFASIDNAKNISQIIRHMLFFGIVFGLLVTLAIFSPIAIPLSLPVTLIACGICTFISLPIFLRTAIYGKFFTSLKSLLITTLVFGLFVALALFSPIALSFSLPFILAASGLLAIVFSRTFCNNVTNKNSNKEPYIICWLAVTGLVSGIFIMLGIFTPFAIPLSLPFILAASGLLAIAFSRVFCNHIINMITGKQRDLSVIFKSIAVAAFFFIPLVVIGLFAPIAISLSIPTILAASALGSLALSRVFFNAPFELGSFKIILAFAISGLIGFALLSSITVGILTIASMPLSLPFILAVGGIGIPLIGFLGCHIYTIYKRAASKAPESVSEKYSPLHHPCSHSVCMFASLVADEVKMLFTTPYPDDSAKQSSDDERPGRRLNRVD